jgi:hypothetical protein
MTEADPDRFVGMSDASETDRLINTDVSALTGVEMLEHLDAVEQRMTERMKTELELLESSPEIVADRPELQARLDHLRAAEIQ